MARYISAVFLKKKEGGVLLYSNTSGATSTLQINEITLSRIKGSDSVNSFEKQEKYICMKMS